FSRDWSSDVCSSDLPQNATDLRIYSAVRLSAGSRPTPLPRRLLRPLAKRTIRSRTSLVVDTNEVQNSIFVGHRRVLQRLQVLLVLEIRTGEDDVARAMRFGQHGLELNIGDSPLGLRLPNDIRNMRNERLTVAGPPFSAGAGCFSHGFRKTFKARTVRCEGTRTLSARHRNHRAPLLDGLTIIRSLIFSPRFKFRSRNWLRDSSERW